ncbi:MULTISPECIES: hypothetical protein [unclassified Streptosporangium]|uniref:hypothetical protein n=1 Tax=unclassified Streptosporangium TaxID=2632669 RepID=UPI002E2A15B0|nr:MULTISPECIES: hypothetical protein [unclassified Streptosporangium]
MTDPKHVDLDPQTLFHRLRGAAMAFDQRLNAGLDEKDVTVFDQVLDRLSKDAATGGR